MTELAIPKASVLDRLRQRNKYGLAKPVALSFLVAALVGDGLCFLSICYGSAHNGFDDDSTLLPFTACFLGIFIGLGVFLQLYSRLPTS